MRPKFAQSLGALGVLFDKGTFLYHLDVFPPIFWAHNIKLKRANYVCAVISRYDFEDSYLNMLFLQGELIFSIKKKKGD